jgi:putative transposase
MWRTPAIANASSPGTTPSTSSGIGWHHPIDVHSGHPETVRAGRADVLTTAYTRNPERFVRKHPEPPALPTAAWINQPIDPDEQQEHTVHSMNP